MPMITSSQNERVKLTKALQQHAKTRRKEGKIVLEGERLVHDLLELGLRPEFVLYGTSLSSRTSNLVRKLAALQIPTLELEDALFAEISDTETPQGVIAVMPTPEYELPEVITLVLLLDGIADPGNLGTMLRTAAAAGVDVVGLMPGCVDPFNPKVLRSGMGAHFRTTLVTLDWDDLPRSLPSIPFYAADAHVGKAYTSINWTQPSGLIIGSESHGLSPQGQGHAAATVTIPMANAAESINAAASAAVILFEARRQRTT